MVFPIFGLMAMGMTAAAAAMNVGAANSAPRTMSGPGIKKRYDERIGEATDAAQASGMASSLSLARSGSGTGGGRASALRAAMMQAPEIQARSTEAGFNAGTNAAGSEVQSRQIGHSQETDRHFRPYEAATRGIGAAAAGFSDMENMQMLTGGGRYATSDERSKAEIKRLTDENVVLNYALKMAQEAERELIAGRKTAAMRNDPNHRGWPPDGAAPPTQAGMSPSSGAAEARQVPAQPEVIDIDALPDQPQTSAARWAQTATAAELERQKKPAETAQPEYGSDAYYLQNYDPDILEFRKKQKATTRQKRVLKKGK